MKARRVYWHNFIKNHGKAFKQLQKNLKHHGFDLELVFDQNQTCTDAFIVALKSAEPAATA